MSTTTRPKHLLTPCRNADALHLWVLHHLGLNVPREPVCAHHDAPFAYLKASYFEPGKDLVVWAPRGGGKTRLGAVATLLDLLHKPGVAVRILGGSVEQSLKMWEHLLPDLERHAGDLMTGRTRTRRVGLRNGSVAAVLTQSQRAVRGLRVQKLRCDEVELFDDAVWEAAQLVTRSMKLQSAHRSGGTVGESDRNVRPTGWTQGGGRRRVTGRNACPTEEGSSGHEHGATIDVAGAVEALSTLHAPYGLMSRVVEAAGASGTRVIRWCVLDVLERCPAERACATCPLWDDCGGVAKTRCDGFVRIDDAIAMKRRVSDETWQSEMLCRKPSVRGCVFPAFEVEVHVCEEMRSAECGIRNEEEMRNTAPKERMAEAGRPSSFRTPHSEFRISLAVDFGYANPFVCLWVATREGVAHVVDEYVQPLRTVEEHVRELAQRPWGAGRGTVVACDPAGNGRSEQTGRSSVDALRAAGYLVRSRPSRIVDGLELIRAALKPAAGEPRLFVHPRCERLIKALRSYHYPPGGGELPVKDGEHDHLIDALRYHYVNHRFADLKTVHRRY